MICHACGLDRLTVKRRRCARCRKAGKRALPSPPDRAKRKRLPPLGWFQRSILAEVAACAAQRLSWLPSETNRRFLDSVSRLVSLDYLSPIPSACDEEPFAYAITAAGLARLNEGRTAR